MPKSPKNWPFPNRFILVLNRDTLVLLNRHGQGC
ncbi:hypothetical protein F383_24639 [Gossypium arboreum]|uniref:Uncharacterized protein n=1 Tax=Gossypium arboreum TaxID=29729 RepID=A0A0B0P3Q7_GOSAR|nr:hypothetical protein F383_24639 [Gossypium arboreum]